MTVSNSPFSISLLRIVRQGLLRAFASNAQTPILPNTLAFCSCSFSNASVVDSVWSVCTDDMDDLCVLLPDVCGLEWRVEMGTPGSASVCNIDGHGLGPVCWAKTPC